MLMRLLLGHFLQILCSNSRQWEDSFQSKQVSKGGIKYKMSVFKILCKFLQLQKKEENMETPTLCSLGLVLKHNSESYR